MIHQNTIKLADFGYSRLQGSDKKFTKPRGILPYMDPKILNDTAESYDLTEKSDIYSLGIVFWELTSCSSPFDFETKKDLSEINQIMLEILDGKRENPRPETNEKFVALYKSKYKINYSIILWNFFVPI